MSSLRHEGRFAKIKNFITRLINYSLIIACTNSFTRIKERKRNMHIFLWIQAKNEEQGQLLFKKDREMVTEITYLGGERTISKRARIFISAHG
jgi:hypothetical protein